MSQFLSIQGTEEVRRKRKSGIQNTCVLLKSWSLATLISLAAFEVLVEWNPEEGVYRCRSWDLKLSSFLLLLLFSEGVKGDCCLCYSQLLKQSYQLWLQWILSWHIFFGTLYHSSLLRRWLSPSLTWITILQLPFSPSFGPLEMYLVYDR